MLLLISVFLAGASLSLVQALQNASTVLPQCAQHCALQASYESTCTAINLTCVCKDPIYAAAFGKCETTQCTAAEQNTTNAYASSLCVQVGGYGHVNSTTSSTAATASGSGTSPGKGAMTYSNTTSHTGTFMGTPTPFVTGGSGVIKGRGVVVLAGLLAVGIAVAL